jgi:multimeric flavodoxin WrbA
MVQRIFALHTSTHAPDLSSSAALTRAAIDRLTTYFPKAEVRWVDGAKLNVTPNLSCYANGKKNCGDPASGPYRCWSNFEAMKDPKKWGHDDMPVVYDNLAWCDTFLCSTSNRWGSHSAVLQNIIERMNTLENRGSSLGEPYPLKGKKLGVVATGLHWKTPQVGAHLLDTLKWWGFAHAEDCVLTWQRSNDPFFEHPDNDLPYEKKWLLTPKGQWAVEKFARSVASATKTVV